MEKLWKNRIQSLETSKIPGTEEISEVLDQGKNFRFVRTLSKGHTTDWMVQDETEWVLLFRGQARLQKEGEEEITLHPGDAITIHAGEKHRVTWTTPDEVTVWACIYIKE